MSKHSQEIMFIVADLLGSLKQLRQKCQSISLKSLFATFCFPLEPHTLRHLPCKLRRIENHYMEGNIKLRSLHGVEHLVAGVVCLLFPPRAPGRRGETDVCIERKRKLASITVCRACEINRLLYYAFLVVKVVSILHSGGIEQRHMQFLNPSPAAYEKDAARGMQRWAPKCGHTSRVLPCWVTVKQKTHTPLPMAACEFRMTRDPVRRNFWDQQSFLFIKKN